MKKLSLYIKESNELSNIPVDCGLENPMYYDKDIKYSKFLYFGDCTNTAKIWDATQMAGFVNSCNVINNQSSILDMINDGDKKIPKKFIKVIDKLKSENKIDDLSEIVIGLNDYQRILFIYLSDLDIHFFFDCKK